MKTPEDEAFDDLAKKQGAWGGGFKAKKAMAADKLQEPVTEHEALKLSRQLLWRYRHETPMGHQPHMICHQADEAFDRIDEALAQPAQEPVAWALEWTFDGEEKGRRLYDDERHCKLDAENDGGICRPLVYGYTPPPQREWVGLTEDEMSMIGYAVNGDEFEAMRLAEAKLKEKNT